ncbi:phospholipid scramblase 2-like [Pollicipes pollicipes]|uniref:phospholipid scramblase 2-like n=1 Tax=Pollicipes pollicipes TaxID=41117 RepID=UPI0018855C9E|nr:phospholipid scramblase 2-like [Pollicipes pollicipes]
MSCTDDSKITVSVVVHGSAGDPDASSVTSAPAELASCLSLTEPTAPALGSHESLMRRFQLADTLIGRIAEQPEIRESLVTRLLDVELFVMQPIYLSHRFQEYSGEKLMVMDQHGNPLLFAVETNRSAVRRGCCCCCAAHRRPLQMMRAYLRDVIRTQEEHQDATDAAPSELFYGVIRQRWHPTRAEFVCSGIRGGVVLRVRGPRRGCCATNATSSFHILSMYGRARLGSVGARWRPLNVDVFRRSDNYGVQFDRGLPSRAKITLLGAAMLLDFLYFNV